MTKLTDKIWAVEVPQWQDAELHFQPSIEDMLNDRPGMSELIIWYTAKACGSPKIKMTAKLPMTGSYRFLFTTKTATEEDARKVVAKLNNGVYHDYAYSHFDPCDEYAPCYLSALESLHSLLRSKSLDPENNYALIENTTNGK